MSADDAVFALGLGGGDDDVLKEAVLFAAPDQLAGKVDGGGRFARCRPSAS